MMVWFTTPDQILIRDRDLEAGKEKDSDSKEAQAIISLLMLNKIERIKTISLRLTMPKLHVIYAKEVIR
jgi:hypothetical protein